MGAGWSRHRKIHGFVSLGRLSLDSTKKNRSAGSWMSLDSTKKKRKCGPWKPLDSTEKTEVRPLDTIGFNHKKQWMSLCSPLTLEYTYSPLTTINPTEYLACGLVPASKDPRFCFFGAAEIGFHKKKTEAQAPGCHWIQRKKKRKCGPWKPLDSTEITEVRPLDTSGFNQKSNGCRCAHH